MRKSLFVVFVLGISISAQAQYWQQKVDYRISVKLDDKLHRLYADLAFDYYNNSQSRYSLTSMFGRMPIKMERRP